MARLLRADLRPWAQQPPAAIALDRTARLPLPAAAALPRAGGALCFAGRGFVEPVARMSGSGLKVSPGAAGLGVDGSALTTAACRLHATARTTTGALKNAWDSPTGPVTFVAVVERMGTNGNGASPIFTNGSASVAPYSAYGISLSTANALSVACSAGGTLRTLTLDTLAANALTVVVGRYDGTRLEGFVNGIISASSVVCTGNLSYPGSGASPGGPAVGNYYQYTSNARSFAGRVYLAAVWAEALSDAQIAALSANPWQIFTPRRLAGYAETGGAQSVALAAVGVSVAGGSAQGSIAVPLSAAGISVSGGSANGVATVSISAAGLAQAAGQAGLSAAVLLQAAGAAAAAGNATLAAQLSALASGVAQASGSANLTNSAPGALSATGGSVASGSAVLSVSVQLQATGTAQAAGSASGAASAPGTLSASGQANASGFATWSALVTLSAAGFVQAMGAGSFSAEIPLQAAGEARAAGAATARLSGGKQGLRIDTAIERITRVLANVESSITISCAARRANTLINEVRHA